MIRINVTNQTEYFRLRKEYLKKIAKYVVFDEVDIIPDSVKEREGKTVETARKLKTQFPPLYRFLFNENGTLKKEKLALLLAGPGQLPKSLGGSSPAMSSMREYFEGIINSCGGVCYGSAAKDCCKKIFLYDNFVANKDAYWLLRKQKIRVCPYCNRIYTVTLPSKEELRKGEEFKTSRATLDHFYSQADYPYLAMSLFNLVVSCWSCNQSKGSKKADIVYPYDEEFGKDAVFCVMPDLSKKAREQTRQVLNFLHGENELFCIKFMAKDSITLQNDLPLEDRLSAIQNEELRRRIIASVQMFHLEELFKEHKKEIRDILRNRYYFDEQYIRAVIYPLISRKMRKNRKINQKNKVSDCQTGNENYDDVETMAMDMLFFSYTCHDEWGERPLSKLVSDILEQVSVPE